MKTFQWTFIASFLFFACNPPQEHKIAKQYKVRYGPEDNPERIKRGITIVPENYAPEITDNYGMIWHNPDAMADQHRGQPNHRQKRIRDNDTLKTIISETDYFYNGKTATIGNAEESSTLDVELEITYYYHPENKNLGQWSCTLFPVPLLSLSIEQADSVLTSWGINRIYPDKKIK